jgi:hypothetical protein
VPEQQDRFALGIAGEIDLQTISEFKAAMQLNSSAERFKPTGEKRRDPVDGLLIVAGRLDLDEFTNGSDQTVLMF